MAYARKKSKKIAYALRVGGNASRVGPITSRATRKIQKGVVSVACDAEKFSGDADLFAEGAAGRKMRRTNRRGG